MTKEQIETLRQTRKPQSRIRIKSPQSGTVIEKSAVEGDYVKTGQKLYRIADLTSVWLMLDLFPDDASAVRFGQQVEAEIQSMQGEVFTGRVAFIDPTVNPKTRTVRVRVEVMNFDGKLRPGDYATAGSRYQRFRPTSFTIPHLPGSTSARCTRRSSATSRGHVRCAEWILCRRPNLASQPSRCQNNGSSPFHAMPSCWREIAE